MTGSSCPDLRASTAPLTTVLLLATLSLLLLPFADAKSLPAVQGARHALPQRRWNVNTTIQNVPLTTGPTGSATGAGGQLPTPSCQNTTDCRCTINVPNADLYWWATQQYTFITATYLGLYDAQDKYVTAWTSVPDKQAPSTYDIASFLASPTRVGVATSVPETTYTGVDGSFTTVFSALNLTTYRDQSTPAPVAPKTIVLERQQYMPAPTKFPASDFDKYKNILGPASTVIGSPGPNAFTAVSATPFLRFHQYEIAYPQYTTTINLARDQGYPVHVTDLNNVACASGPVPAAFKTALPDTGCALGQWRARPTVIVVIVDTWALVLVKAVRVEQTQGALLVPTAKPEPGSKNPNGCTGNTCATEPPLGYARIETPAANGLIVPGSLPAPPSTPANLPPGSEAQIDGVDRNPAPAAPASPAPPAPAPNAYNNNPASPVGHAAPQTQPPSAPDGTAGSSNEGGQVNVGGSNPGSTGGPGGPGGQGSSSGNSGSQNKLGEGPSNNKQASTGGSGSGIGLPSSNGGPGAENSQGTGATNDQPSSNVGSGSAIGQDTGSGDNGSGSAVLGQLPALTIGGMTLSPAATRGVYIVQGQTLAPGGAPVTLTLQPGQTITAGPTGNTAATPAPGQSLITGAATLSLGPGAAYIAINGITSTISALAPGATGGPKSKGNNSVPSPLPPGTTPSSPAETQPPASLAIRGTAWSFTSFSCTFLSLLLLILA